MKNKSRVEWREVSGYPTYKVNSLGKVLSFSCRKKGKPMTPYLDKHGYWIYTLTRDGVCKHIKAHRVVALSFLGDSYFEGAMVNHKNFNKKDNRVCNLEWVDNRRNVDHAVLGKRYNNRGSKNPRSKLTEKQVINIRKNYDGTKTFRDIAEEYGVYRKTISSIINRRHWTHI